MAALPAADQRQDRTFPPHLRDRWVDARLYAFTEQRNDGLPDWMHFYNNDRVHSAIGGRPASRHTDQFSWISDWPTRLVIGP